jgi:hypothetical protein
MFELNKKVAPQENLVGWFATGKIYRYRFNAGNLCLKSSYNFFSNLGSEITSHSALIHDYYARETKVCVKKYSCRIFYLCALCSLA